MTEHTNKKPSLRRGSERVLPRPGLATCAIAVLLIGIAFAFQATQAGASNISQLNSKINSANAQAQGLRSGIQANGTAIAEQQGKAAAAAAQEVQLTGALVRAQQHAAVLAKKLDAARKQLARVRERFGRSQHDLSNRLVDIYEQGQPDDLELLLSSKGYDDLATRAEMLNRIQAADSALVSRVRSLRSQVAGQVDRVGGAKQKADAYQAQVDSARQQVIAIRAGAEAQAAQLTSARNAQIGQLEGLRSSVSSLAKQLSAAKQAQAEREAARAAQSAASSSAPTSAPAAAPSGDWAIPESIVMCESGGNWNAVNPSSGAGGAYQILPSTWALYGGHGNPQDASPAQQSAIAAQIWADSGPGAWECAG